MPFDLLHSIGFTDASDDELLTRYKKTGNQKWISKLFARYVHLIYGVCLRYSPDVREAEDMTMDIYAKVADKAQSHNIKHFKNWLYVLSKNYCLEQIRKMTGRRIETFDPAFMQLRDEIHPIDEMANLELKERQFEKLEECLKSLNELQRTSIRLFYYENKTYAEIAGLIEDEISQVRSYLQNGRRNIRKCMGSG